MDAKFAEVEAALKQGRAKEAAVLAMAALDEAAPPFADCRSLSAMMFRAGELKAAERLARAGLEQQPKNFDLMNILGVSLRRQGRFAEALEVLDRATRLAPKDPAGWTNKGNVLVDLGEGARAVEVFTRLVRLKPGIAELHRMLGVAYRQTGDLEKAQTRFAAAVRLQPTLVDVWLDLVGLASGLQKHEDALAMMAKALEANPGEVRLMEAKGVLLRRWGMSREAEAEFRAVLEKDDSLAWAHHQLARSVRDGDRRDANEHFERAVELDPKNLVYRLAFADSLNRSRYGDEGAHIQKAYEIVLAAMEMGAIPSGWFDLLQTVFVRVGAFDQLDRVGDFATLGRQWAMADKHAPFLQHLSRVRTPADRLELVHQHRLWGERVEARAARNPIKRPPARPRNGGKYRIGFMSSDLRNHPVGYFALPIFEYADRERFEVYAYSFYQGEEDGVQKLIASKIDGFSWRKDISDRDAAQRIADDQLDILFELGGSTHMNKIEVMAYRPAPLQASWLGYPHSVGLSTIDYLLTDPYITPPDPRLLIEKPLIMPHTWLALGRLQFRDEPVVDPTTPESRNGFITFGTANNPHKYSAEMLRTWAQVVAAVPGSRFLFVRPEGGVRTFRENMLAAFAAEGVSEDRVRFEAVRGTHLPFYNQIDIALDTFPLTGGTTTCESLWMGVPVVNLVGEALFERLSHSLLINAGLGHLSKRTVEDYVATAVALAADPEQRRILRETLRETLKVGPLGDTKAFAKDFYDLMARTLESHRQIVQPA